VALHGGHQGRAKDLEDFADFYRNRMHRADDPFGGSDKLEMTLPGKS